MVNGIDIGPNPVIVIPSVLSEYELAYFDADCYGTLKSVISIPVATTLKEYLDNPSANSVLKEFLINTCGDDIKEKTFHIELKDMGILDIVKETDPTTLNVQHDLVDIIDKLGYVRENLRRIYSKIPRIESECFDNFVAILRYVERRMIADHAPMHFTKLADRALANKILFYDNTNTNVSTSMHSILSDPRRLEQLYNGARYLKYLADNNLLNYDKRSFW